MGGANANASGTMGLERAHAAIPRTTSGIRSANSRVSRCALTPDHADPRRSHALPDGGHDRGWSPRRRTRRSRSARPWRKAVRMRARATNAEVAGVTECPHADGADTGGLHLPGYATVPLDVEGQTRLRLFHGGDDLCVSWTSRSAPDHGRVRGAPGGMTRSHELERAAALHSLPAGPQLGRRDLWVGASRRLAITNRCMACSGTLQTDQLLSTSHRRLLTCAGMRPRVSWRPCSTRRASLRREPAGG